VHGLAHANHAPPSAKKAEFGPHRPISAMAQEAGQGLAAIRTLFGARALDVFVPPWNRIAPELVVALPALGFAGLSASGPVAPDAPIPTVNTQLDPIDWHGGGSLLDGAALAAMWRRIAFAETQGDRTVPLGVLTHHLVMDETVWGFCDALFALLRGHRAVVFPELAKLWAKASIQI
jgi:hypothetical protein